ncbi:hypothetical protein [Pimelobacter simplex]|uniref:hypothetical protein n=1 Tax=Nocardioides simplex TaxID=2045 RepID=UPI003AB0E684
MRIRVTRSARKHRIGNGHIIAALVSADAPIIDGEARTYVGVDDDRGVALEIVVVPDDRRPGGWAVIHAMPTSYRIRSVGGGHREG